MSDTLRDAFVTDPPSEAIAAELNAGGALVCEHGRNPCLLYCGVRLTPPADVHYTHTTEGGTTYRKAVFTSRGGTWSTIALEERLAWLGHVEELIARDEGRAP